MKKNNSPSSIDHIPLPAALSDTGVPSDAAPAVLTLRSVSLGWRGKWAWRDATGVCQQGCLYAVVGPNGAGKSTFLIALVWQLPPAQGQIQRASTARFAYLPQHHGLDLSFPMSVYDFVALGLWAEVGAFRALTRAQHGQVQRSEEHTSELQSRGHLVCRLLLEKKT